MGEGRQQLQGASASSGCEAGASSQEEGGGLPVSVDGHTSASASSGGGGQVQATGAQHAGGSSAAAPPASQDGRATGSAQREHARGGSGQQAGAASEGEDVGGGINGCWASERACIQAGASARGQQGEGASHQVRSVAIQSDVGLRALGEHSGCGGGSEGHGSAREQVEGRAAIEGEARAPRGGRQQLQAASSPPHQHSRGAAMHGQQARGGRQQQLPPAHIHPHSCVQAGCCSGGEVQGAHASHAGAARGGGSEQGSHWGVQAQQAIAAQHCCSLAQGRKAAGAIGAQQPPTATGKQLSQLAALQVGAPSGARAQGHCPRAVQHCSSASCHGQRGGRGQGQGIPTAQAQGAASSEGCSSGAGEQQAGAAIDAGCASASGCGEGCQPPQPSQHSAAGPSNAHHASAGGEGGLLWGIQGQGAAAAAQLHASCSPGVH